MGKIDNWIIAIMTMVITLTFFYISKLFLGYTFNNAEVLILYWTVCNFIHTTKK